MVESGRLLICSTYDVPGVQIPLSPQGTVVQWLECHPVTVEVAGSSPVSLEFLLAFVGRERADFKKAAGIAQW